MDLARRAAAAGAAPARRGGARRSGGPRHRLRSAPLRRPATIGAMPTSRRGGSRRSSRRHAPANPPVDVHVPDGVRLQKVLAQAGVGSRRACEQLIAQGRVEVDGQVVAELGVRVDPATAVVHVDGLRVQLDESKITVAVNKPLGMLSSMSDPEGRPTVAELVQDRPERLFHVGRLDADSEGLLLLTNDGELGNRLSHPSYEIPKTYLVTVEGAEFYPRHAKELTAGVELDDGPARMDKVRVVDSVPGRTMIEVVLHEGRNRIVRRMFDAIGFPVTRLVRTRIGPITLGDLKAGRTRVLGRTELGTLMRAVDL
ncbi:pseudouridine synthase [Isoptericola sp. b515]|nr:pseudouridine synthase [Isoptericola sp. b515]MDO8149712.1 pseudouridine synthase [Isoptericola sp. b515]